MKRTIEAPGVSSDILSELCEESPNFLKYDEMCFGTKYIAVQHLISSACFEGTNTMFLDIPIYWADVVHKYVSLLILTFPSIKFAFIGKAANGVGIDMVYRAMGHSEEEKEVIDMAVTKMKNDINEAIAIRYASVLRCCNAFLF